jgi:hypothetical protein
MAGIPKACTCCRRLRDCKTVTEYMLENGECCGDWRPVNIANMDARRTIIEGLGPGALRYEVQNLSSGRAKIQPRRRRRHV